MSEFKSKLSKTILYNLSIYPPAIICLLKCRAGKLRCVAGILIKQKR